MENGLIGNFDFHDEENQENKEVTYSQTCEFCIFKSGLKCRNEDSPQNDQVVLNEDSCSEFGSNL